MNDPQDEKKYEFSFKITCKGSLPNGKDFGKMIENMKIDFKEILELNIEDFGSIEIEEL
jgi:hypothetical protein